MYMCPWVDKSKNHIVTLGFYLSKHCIQSLSNPVSFSFKIELESDNVVLPLLRLLLWPPPHTPCACAIAGLPADLVFVLL